MIFFFLFFWGGGGGIFFFYFFFGGGVGFFFVFVCVWVFYASRGPFTASPARLDVHLICCFYPQFSITQS